MGEKRSLRHISTAERNWKKAGCRVLSAPASDSEGLEVESQLCHSLLSALGKLCDFSGPWLPSPSSESNDTDVQVVVKIKRYQHVKDVVKS